MLVTIFWVCVGIVAGEYLLYHAVLRLVAHRTVSAPDPEEWPHLAVLICTHNEAPTIAAKIANVLAADYPTGRLTIVIGDDGSDDDTVAIVEQLGVPNIRIHAFPKRRGKIAVQRDVIAQVEVPIFVFTDATVRMPPNALRSLARHFTDTRVGGVSARMHVANTADNWLIRLQRLLFEIQNAQKAGECRLDSAGGLYGQLCAVRRDALGQVPADVVYEDREFGIRLRERGYRVLLDDETAAEYLVPETVADFRAQKQRIAGAMTQSVGRHRRMLFNRAYGWYGAVILPEYALFRVLRQPLLALGGLCLAVTAVGGAWPAAGAHAIGGAAVLLLSFWGGSVCLLPYIEDRAGFLRRLVTALPGLGFLAAVLAFGSARYLWRGQSAAWQRISRKSPHASDPP